MDAVEILLWVAQGLFALLLGLVGWVLRRALDDQERLREQLIETRERLVRAEGRLNGLDRLEAKLDQLVGEVKEVRERFAAWGPPPARG